MSEYNTSRFQPKKEAQTHWDLDRTIIWDVESHDWSKPLVIGALEPDGTYREFTDNPVKSFGDYCMQSKHRNYRFVSHNGGGYDHGFMLDYLLEYSQDTYNWNILESNGDLFYLEIEDEHGKPRHFQDSIKIMPRSLENLADSFADVGKLSPDKVDIHDLPTDLSDLNTDEREELTKYLKRDCVALRQCLQEFTDIISDLTNGNVGPQLTVASTALSVYQCHFMQDEKLENGIKQSEPHIEAKTRESYYGGRTEVFKQRAHQDNGPYHHYDVNSLFPSCYTNFRLPAGKPHYIEDPEGDILSWDQFGGVVRINAVVDEDTQIPVLPNRYKPESSNAEKVLFPTGPVTGWYSMREVRYAKEIGQFDSLQIEEAVLSRLEYCFEKFGNAMYERKRNIDSDKNPARYKVVKFCLNSPYGKFGMEREQSQIKRVNPNGENFPPENGTTLGTNKGRERKLFHEGVFKTDDTAEASYIIPRIASAITAQARIEMHKWFMKCKELGGNIWYCDTDSIVTDIELPEKFVNDELGMMDHEHTVKEGVFCRPKTYAEITEDGENTIKGKGMRDINSDTPHNDPITARDMIDAFDNDNPGKISASWRGPEGLKTTLKNDAGGISVKEYSRSLSGWDDKRRHINDTTSIPLNMAELWRKETRKAQAKHRNAKVNEMLQSRFGGSPSKDGYGIVEDQDAEADISLSAAENKREKFKQQKREAIDEQHRRKRYQ